MVIVSFVQSRKLQENGWKPRWFQKDSKNGTFRYMGGYWESREEKKWEDCPDIFGEFSVDPNVTPLWLTHTANIRCNYINSLQAYRSSEMLVKFCCKLFTCTYLMKLQIFEAAESLIKVCICVIWSFFSSFFPLPFHPSIDIVSDIRLLFLACKQKNYVNTLSILKLFCSGCPHFSQLLIFIVSPALLMCKRLAFDLCVI